MPALGAAHDTGALPDASRGETASASASSHAFGYRLLYCLPDLFPGKLWRALSPSFPSPLSNGPSQGIYWHYLIIAITRSCNKTLNL
jgi:hypothetical protein